MHTAPYHAHSTIARANLNTRRLERIVNNEELKKGGYLSALFVVYHEGERCLPYYFTRFYITTEQLRRRQSPKK